jgi:hypothetical protein
MQNNLQIKKFFFFLLVAGIFFAGFSATPPPRQLFFQYENTVWWGTEFGLNRFQSENEQWANIRSEPVSDLCLDEKVLWVGSDKGVFYADLRYLDWKEYTAKQGLSSDTVVRVAADLDFVYAAGPHGLARFNKLVEQWEPMGDFSDKRIYDLYSNQTHLWIATDQGVFYFDKKFEKWESYSAGKGLLSNTVYRLFYFGDYIWALTDKGFSRYSATMKTWNSYPFNELIGTAVNYLLVDASYIWVLSPEGVSRFSVKNQAWEKFSRSMPIEKLTVSSISTSGTTAWFSTSDGVYSFNEDQRRWKTYTSIDGLSDDVQEQIFTTGQTTLCKKGTSFSFLRPAEDLWIANEIKLTAASGAFKPKWKAHMDETGLGVTAPSGQSLNLLGRAYVKVKNKAEFPEPLATNIGNYLTNTDLDAIDTVKTAAGFDSITLKSRYNDFLYGWAKAQLNLNADLGSGRTLRATLDNTDPLGDRRYGAEYRGFGEDNLRRLGWRTDQKADYFNSTLIDPTYLEGAGVRTEFGDRVGDKKLRRVNTGVWAGWRKTEYLRKLLPFREDNFYEFGAQNLVTESVEIKIDGKVIDPSEYSIERTMGLLTFKNESVANPDSRIEVSCEYQPRLGEFPSFRSRTDDPYSKNLGDSLKWEQQVGLGMASAENVVVVNDKVQVGVNGVYRGIKEPDAAGQGQATNQMYAGSVNSKIEMKSNDGKLYLRAVPEVSSSYNDSILIKKQGAAAKLGVYSVLNNLKLKMTGLLQDSNYVSMTDQQSVYGRTNLQTEGELVYDAWQQYMPITVGAGYTGASSGSETREYFQYLVSLPNLPSLRLFGMHQGMKNYRREDSRDSIKTERWNGIVETEWDLPEWGRTIFLDRLWLNASYSINLLSDSLFNLDTIAETSVIAVPPLNTLDTIEGTHVNVDSSLGQRINHNIFGWVRWSPHKKIQLEGKSIFRFFYDRETDSIPYKYAGNRIRPEFKLFSQEFIPGITMYGKYLFEITNEFIPIDDAKKTSNAHKLNSSVLVVPGVYWDFLNWLQLNGGYNFSTQDTVKLSNLSGRTPTSKKSYDAFEQSFVIKPMLDFSEDLHFASRTEISNGTDFSQPLSDGVKIYNEARTAFRDRKTRLDLDFNIFNETKYNHDKNLADTLQLKSNTIETRFKWTERWLQQNFRTELPIGLSWKSSDSILTKNIIPSSTTSTGYLNSLASGVLFDWRIQGKIVREFRIQYYIGFTLADGTFFNFVSYNKALDNKLDIMVKVGNNFFIRMLCNVSYLFDDKMMKYDLAELKATALF